MRTRYSNSGSILMIPLVLGALFLVTLLSTAGYVNLQFRRSTQIELQDRALFAGEAGIHYISEALTKGWYTTYGLLDIQALGIALPHIPGSSVALSFVEVPGLDPSVAVKVLASGLTSNDVCEATEALIVRTSTENVVFTPYNWNPLPSCHISDCWAGMTGVEEAGTDPVTYQLSWTSRGAESCTINGNSVAVSGAMSVPSNTETDDYHLACSCSGGDTYEQAISCNQETSSCVTTQILVNGQAPTPSPSPLTSSINTSEDPFDDPFKSSTPIPSTNLTPSPTTQLSPAPTGGGDDCGDGVCTWWLSEDTNNCVSDCQTAQWCGNGFCDGGDTIGTCPSDCANPSSPPDPTPSPEPSIVEETPTLNPFTPEPTFIEEEPTPTPTEDEPTPTPDPNDECGSWWNPFC